ncbi:monovalent cation/H(+) antiporter subunit G [Dethiosulfovibrio salsuginis]|uniref:Multicomponent Na+:H+ antiporter subunit G n=1 Tax=Dethiosulfovibrio salsuginis TaxID=561720 RepID=A0A1X7JLG5_9BACT|nr:monovalent cation/H(+) antiporter subunit G [Dethiosulfovibrio salsuginis]SMG28659.1 multicomponent Na+:H+ antiporter subunit G [Dethiosulfovibrio salsuginis]
MGWYVFPILFILLGLLINTLGTFSLYRFPDVYTRMHGSTKCTTFGTMSLAFGVVLYAVIRRLQSGEVRFSVLAVHVVIAVIALLISNATGAHVLARAAHRSKAFPKDAVVDSLAERDERLLKEGIER